MQNKFEHVLRDNQSARLKETVTEQLMEESEFDTRDRSPKSEVARSWREPSARTDRAVRGVDQITLPISQRIEEKNLIFNLVSFIYIFRH